MEGAIKIEDLEIECEECGGRGHDFMGACGYCDGSGKRMTELGETIYRFIADRIYYKQDYKERASR